MVPMLGFAFAAMITLAAQTSATAADRIQLAVQRTGTLAWELDVIRAHGLDRKFDLAIETIELASTEAGKIALKGGSADLMLSDWLWVARERSLGDNLVFYPSSSTLGAVMAPAQSPIREIIGLRGKKLAVAGGTLDKSWLLLQARARRLNLLPAGRCGVNVGARLVSLALLIAVWYAGSQLAGARLLPDPQAVALAILDEGRSGALAFNLGATLARVAVAFIIALLLG